MTPAECTQVLAIIAVAESRVVDQVMVSFWLNTLAVNKITADEFRRAVISHYATSTYPIRPGHVWAIVQQEREWANAESIIDDTLRRRWRTALAEEAGETGAWAEFDATFPGYRQEQKARELVWWIEHPQHEPTQQILDGLAEFGLTLPDRCERCGNYDIDDHDCQEGA